MCKIEFNLDEPLHVTVKVVDVMGTLVQTLMDDNKPAGHYDIEFNDDKLNAGRYYYKVFTEPAQPASGTDIKAENKAPCLLKSGSVRIKDVA